MTTQIISDINFNDPTNLIPYLEKDDAIIRNVCKSMLDFSNPASLTTGPLPVGTLATSLTADGQTGSVQGGALPAQAGGLVNFGGGAVGSSYRMQLPDNFKLAAGTKRFLVIAWVKLPNTGYLNDPNTNYAVITNGNNTTTLAQWYFNLISVQATGVPNLLQWGHPYSATQANATISLSNADTLALCNGSLHQLAGYLDGENVGAGNAQASIWVDGVQKAAGSVFAWDGSILQPASSPRLAAQNAFQSAYPANFKLGRPSMWNLTGTAWTPQQILQRDWDAAQGYLS